MKVLVTGAAGFIGAHTVRALLDKNVHVVALCRKNTNQWRLKDVADRIEIVTGDMRDINRMNEIFDSTKPEAVSHLAWGGVGGKHRNDYSQLSENLPSTLELIRAAGVSGCNRFVGLGSQAEYGPKENILDENALPAPTTLYGAAKLSACIAGGLLAAEAEMSFAWLRLFSTYGPMDEPHWLIPYLIRTMLSDQSPKLTKGTQRWDYLHVEDLANAVSSTTLTPRAEGIFNLGSGRAVSVREVAELIRDYANPETELKFGEVPFRSDQIMHLQADITRLKLKVDWAPTIRLEEGLKQTVRWFYEHEFRKND